MTEHDVDVLVRGERFAFRTQHSVRVSTISNTPAYELAVVNGKVKITVFGLAAMSVRLEDLAAAVRVLEDAVRADV